ncbi:MAG: DEAD/DEAH box helicase [Acidobacteria bacterium]|nr:MAG: DEAD/DEAH box helicase [Acidobacteriota bacterium]
MTEHPRLPTFPQLELHRHGAALVPPPEEEPPSAAILFTHSCGRRPLRSCTCKASRGKTCGHLLALSQAYGELERALGRRSWPALFEASLWHRLGRSLFEGDGRSWQEVRVSGAGRDGAGTVLVTAPDGGILVRYLDDSPARVRFVERLGRAPAGFVDRGRLLARLALFQATPEERHLADLGMKSKRQTWEESFWYRLAYHCLREHGAGGTFHPAIDRRSGDFTLTFRARPPGAAGDGERPILQLTLPRPRVKAVLRLLARAFPEQDDLAIHPLPLKSIFRISASTELDRIEVRPVIRALQASGEERFFAREDLERFRYGELVYVPELELLAELERPGKERKFRAPRRMRLAKSQVPSFLVEHAAELADGTLVLDETLRGLEIFRSVDRLQIVPEMLDRSWYYLSVRYGVGERTISLASVLQALADGLPYLETEAGWIDLKAPVFAGLAELTGGGRGEAPAIDGERVRLSPRQLLALQTSAGAPVEIGGEAAQKALLERLLALQPASPYEAPAGLVSSLRPYQVLGVDWLRFLWQNRLGGLLCDDMGLGKTHQAMALMLCLREQEGIDAPFLVICPTSVLAHWHKKLREHAPGLRPAIHHGPQRDLEASLDGAGVVITSYGVLRRDVETLAAVPFALVVYDEIQHLKNPGTQAYRAAQRLRAEVKLGLTGTPIENRVEDVKSLFDLVLPGYLGPDERFADRFAGAEGEGAEADERRAELRRRLAPFVLRRLKTAVLDELPEKIEDLYTCTLSDEQVKLYREAIATRGAELRARLETDDGRPLPYIHVFALLNLLKQICDHPALALRDLDRAERYASGKWELYQELLGEALGSGQKVVVFSQYLGMITLMQRHLEALGVGYAVLTGASTGRGAIVERFNHDPRCRVFLGSLKAGGTGIDLIGGSVVIHYDRWWNAAREDQATDRVYRIGQKRAVQVMKLVTEGTLEEKIAAIIERKRRLMDGVVEADDPRLAKVFSRDQLLDLLAPL